MSSLPSSCSQSHPRSKPSTQPIFYSISGPLPIPDVYYQLLTATSRNAELSHITAGYIENSPSKGLVRVDEAYDGELATSFFNYANVTKSGLVDNTLTTYDQKHTKPTVWRGYVNSNFPIFDQNILVKAEAVYQGLVKRDFISSPVAAVSISTPIQKHVMYLANIK